MREMSSQDRGRGELEEHLFESDWWIGVSAVNAPSRPLFRVSLVLATTSSAVSRTLLSRLE